MKTVLCLSLALAVNAEIVQRASSEETPYKATLKEAADPTGDAWVLEGQSCDSYWTNCEGCKSSGDYCGTPSGAPGAISMPPTTDCTTTNCKVVCGVDKCPKLPTSTIDFEADMKKAFDADMVKAEADATNLKAGLADATKQKVVLLPLKCSVRNCKDWNCATWCWCFENYGDQIQAWLDVYAARAGCLADEEDCICKPDGPGPVGPEGDPIDINVVPREWVRRPSQCCVHPAPPPLDSSPSLRARLATLITLHSSTHYMTHSRRRFVKSSSLRNSHTSASTRRASRMALAAGGSPLKRKLLHSSASLICTYPSAATISRRTIASASRISSTMRCKRLSRKRGFRRTALRWFSSRQW